MPQAGSGRPLRLAIASCGTQFGAIFDHLAGAKPDVFVWQGDLNYPDTHGPLAQTMGGYAGIWRDFLANPRLGPILERSAFVAQRDDHDYAFQDSNASTIPRHPWAVAPWDALMGKGTGYRFSAGLADVWVLDQRRHKSEPTLPDTPDKTLLGPHQRKWLLAGLRASKAPFKIVCSPCTLFMPLNARDGNWAAGFTAERDQILEHIDRKVSGRTIFVTGDTHLTGVYDHEGRFEARAAPIDIPLPNDITLTDPLAGPKLSGSPGVSYADERGHFALLEVRRAKGAARLELSLVREDGATAYRTAFEERPGLGRRASAG
jgi:phosphodiesterase/alkaline phosphatase D-like protein